MEAVIAQDSAPPFEQRDNARDRTIHALLRVLTDPTAAASIRSAACDALVKWKATDDETLKALRHILARPEPAPRPEGGFGLRDRVVAALCRLGVDDQASVDAVRAVLRDQSANPELRVSAAYAWGDLRDKHEAARTLREVLFDTTPDVEARSRAAAGLTYFADETDIDAQEALRHVAQDATAPDRVRSTAASALSQFAKNEHNLAALRSIVADRSAHHIIRAAAADGLAALKPADEQTLAALRQALPSASYAATALAELGAADAATLVLLAVPCRIPHSIQTFAGGPPALSATSKLPMIAHVRCFAEYCPTTRKT